MIEKSQDSGDVGIPNTKPLYVIKQKNLSPPLNILKVDRTVIKTLVWTKKY